MASRACRRRLKIRLAPRELVRRGRLLATQGKHLESADIWNQAAAGEPVIAEFARREAVRSLLAAGELARALGMLGELSGPRPAELLVSAADVARDKGIAEQAVTLYRRARQNAGPAAVADDAGLGLAGVLEQSGNAPEALETFRELQLTFRRAATYDLATAGAPVSPRATSR